MTLLLHFFVYHNMQICSQVLCTIIFMAKKSNQLIDKNSLFPFLSRLCFVLVREITYIELKVKPSASLVAQCFLIVVLVGGGGE